MHKRQTHPLLRILITTIQLRNDYLMLLCSGCSSWRRKNFFCKILLGNFSSTDHWCGRTSPGYQKQGAKDSSCCRWHIIRPQMISRSYDSRPIDMGEQPAEDRQNDPHFKPSEFNMFNTFSAQCFFKVSHGRPTFHRFSKLLNNS